MGSFTLRGEIYMFKLYDIYQTNVQDSRRISRK